MRWWSATRLLLITNNLNLARERETQERKTVVMGIEERRSKMILIGEAKIKND